MPNVTCMYSPKAKQLDVARTELRGILETIATTSTKADEAFYTGLNEATRKAEDQKKDRILEAKEVVLPLKQDLDREIHDRRAEQQRGERRRASREASAAERRRMKLGHGWTSVPEACRKARPKMRASAGQGPGRRAA